MSSYIISKIKQSYAGVWRDLMKRPKQSSEDAEQEQHAEPPSFWQILTKDNRYLWILLSITLAVASVAALTLALRLLRGSGGNGGSEACGGSSVDYPRISSAPVELTSLQKKIFASSS